MPRIPSKLLLGAFQENPLLVRLLQECRTVEHARNELRWLRESVIAKSSKKPAIRKEHDRSQCHQQWQRKLRKLCTDRGRGKPLQYILGDQPFGDLEILCQKRVLIPRSETESYTFHARDVILNGLYKEQYKGPLRVLDLCSGTGCISLLLYSLLAPKFSDLTIVGVDDDPHAIELSQKNKRHNIHRGLLPPKAENELFFINADILASAKSKFSSFLQTLQSHVHAKDTTRPRWDVLVSNPPYISPSNLANGTTSRSVRRFEPAHALVPPALESSMWQDLELSHVAREDIFYPAIMYLGHRVDARLIIMECGDLEQARRIVAIAESLKVSLCDAYKRNVYIWDENHRPYDADGGARAVVIERTVA